MKVRIEISEDLRKAIAEYKRLIKMNFAESLMYRDLRGKDWPFCVSELAHFIAADIAHEYSVACNG